MKMFKEEELNSMKVLSRGRNYVEVRCGCTSQRLGDTIGKLKVFANGKFVINCECSDNCSEQKLTPYDFEKHSGRDGARRWKNHIWVFVNEKKVPLRKTVLLKYYKHATNVVPATCRGKRTFHRDEFVQCVCCNKQRRFRLRTKEECRIYHDAKDLKRWRCSNRPYDKINCSVDEEREKRLMTRGCPRNPNCEGCTSCVCLGCLKCRFADCTCRLCVDFMQNAEP
ncbi:hypothetical protein ACOSP7_030692 [Xanthoceras sorbifolium]|uniref:SAND domain-containing protein n=1 Tax=Xanthoceras sorbifolium TaxID=99658 RepID=A0ABQ8H1X8_9ROSI|nr:hypothetical protein JRO89_XS15G0127400 [Xanthoceras sorbifolium]